MATIIEFSKQYEDKVQDSRQGLDRITENPDKPVNPVQGIAKGIRKDIAKTKALTGIDLSGAKVENLPGNIAGLYYLGKGRTKIDQELLESGDEVARIQVLVHEAMHQVNDNNSGGTIIKNEDFLESLNELATEKRTGEFLADNADKSDAQKIASAVGRSVHQLITAYENGENQELNTYFELAQTKKAA